MGAGVRDLDFNHAVATKRSQLLQEKSTIEQRLQQLNGKYYKDPSALLHIAHRAVASDPKAFETLVKEQSSLQKRLKEITFILSGDTEVSHLQLRLKKLEAQKGLQALCGKSYGDKSSQLHKAWRAYQKGQCSLHDYKELDNRRKELEADLFRTCQLLSKAPRLSRVEQLVSAEFQNAIDQLIVQRNAAAAQIGVDKTKLGKRIALGTFGIAAAYVVAQIAYAMTLDPREECLKYNSASVCFPS